MQTLLVSDPCLQFHMRWTHGEPLAQAARDLDVAESVLRRWMRELASAPVAAFPGNRQMRADLAEIAALKKEVARLRAERDILKKAAAFFAREAT